MSPASTNVYHGKYIMRLLEEFISRDLDDCAQAQCPQQEDQYESYHSPDHVQLLDKIVPYFGLRLVELRFDNAPSQGVENGLDEDDTASPSMEEVERLVRDTSDQCQDGFS